ncbi:MAG: hypothetical protein AAGC55_19885, partial [Myxococcota bacterium]
MKNRPDESRIVSLGPLAPTVPEAGPLASTVPSPAAAVRIDRIVLEAAALDSGERTYFLEQLVTEDPRLLAEARRLLDAAAEVSDSFLAVPAADHLAAEHRTSADRTPAEPPPIAPEERYQVGEQLGAGGMAEVFRAHDRQLDRPVALKCLTLSDPDILARCLREARNQARVRHNHVLDVYETGELNGKPFIAMR